MTTYTDEQLKQALAKMLPEQVTAEEEYEDDSRIWWRNTGNYVLDTELLHLCSLVEETFSTDERCQYLDWLDNNDWTWEWQCTHAPWQQRVVALCKVKGVEIV